MLLEGTYKLRKMDTRFENELLRVLGRWYQNLGQIDRANEYRRKAFELLKQNLNSDLDEGTKLEYLYLAANYARQFGMVTDSDRYLADLERAIQQITDPKLVAFGEYLSELAGETKLIQVGGKLDPAAR